jgi:two-component system chemotaxis response regulator CheB
MNKDSRTKNSALRNIVAIGASTGGPKSLQKVIPLIPRNIPAAFLITQHMPPGFTGSLAERLNSMSRLTVKEAVDREIIMPGCVYIAPGGDYHLGVKNHKDGSLRIKLLHSSPVNGHRPSVDVMLESLSQTGHKGIIVVIMTGMGRDGSDGIKKIKKNNNGYIIAQEESSCVVYGMPKMAIETGLVDVIVPLENIADKILKIVGVK